nr:unnamed protein product [Callosobruchus analis]
MENSKLQATVDVDDGTSISSEEETGSAFDTEQRARSKPSSEIWKPEAVWEDLLKLPNADEIHEFIGDYNIRGILETNKDTALLLSSWLGKENILRVCLENGASLDAADDVGRTAFHLAAYAGHVHCLNVLLSKGGTTFNRWDAAHIVTPLHCAAAANRVDCLRALIQHGADVNSGLEGGSPLLNAVQSGAVECVEELLKNGAVANTTVVFSDTPLHLASSLGDLESLKLLLAHGAATDVRSGSDKVAALHLAAADGDARCVSLLLEAGAKIDVKNAKKQTPLHLAALAQSAETVDLLLSKGANPNVQDIDGRTPLHSAIVKVSRSCDCVRLLLTAGADVNKPDNYGYTALHLAALNEFSHCVMLLIDNGGDVTARTNGGVSVLGFITRKTPDVIPKYLQKFDASIKRSDHELGDVDCELKLDFRILVPTMGNKETDLLLNFIEVGHKEVLKHPLCETFLFLKWRRIRKYFLFSLAYHSLFVVLFSVYVIGVFVKNCPSAKSATQPCWVSVHVKNVAYVVIFMNMLLLAKEVFQIAHSWYMYIKQWDNWIQWMIILSVFSCVHPTRNVEQEIHDWQHHAAAISIFLSWLELMMIVGRFPIFGLYIQMFTTVSVNFTKFILAYFCLLIAFALSFGVIFANYPAFSDLKWVLLKVIIMMSGELEYEDVFFPDDVNEETMYPYTAHLMYFCFVLLVTIILTNLMVGLAVSDIQGLQQSAGLDRLVRQAQLVAHLESMLFSRLLGCVPHKLMKFLHKQALLLKSQYHWALYIRPNDPREERIPKELIKSAYQLVVERKEKPRCRGSRKYKSRDGCSDIISPALSRLSSYNSAETNNNRLLKTQLDEAVRELLDSSRILRQKLDRINHLLLNNQV